MHRRIPLEPVCERDIVGEKDGGGPIGIGVFPPGGGGGLIGNEPGLPNDGGKT